MPYDTTPAQEEILAEIERLDKAIASIDSEDKWVQNVEVDDSGLEPRFCMIGALARNGGNVGFYFEQRHDRFLGRIMERHYDAPATAAVYEAIKRLHPVMGYFSIPSFNDYGQRTHAEVIEVMKLAREILHDEAFAGSLSR